MTFVKYSSRTILLLLKLLINKFPQSSLLFIKCLRIRTKQIWELLAYKLTFRISCIFRYGYLIFNLDQKMNMIRHEAVSVRLCDWRNKILIPPQEIMVIILWKEKLFGSYSMIVIWYRQPGSNNSRLIFITIDEFNIFPVHLPNAGSTSRKPFNFPKVSNLRKVIHDLDDEEIEGV